MPLPELPPAQYPPGSHFILDRIGPIVDPAFLRVIDIEIVKEITIIGARAELAAAQTYLKAVQEIVNVVEKAKVNR